MYDIMAVPADTPFTPPPPLTVATDGLLLLHVPKSTVSDSTDTVPVHNVVVPLITPALAPGVTVIACIAEAVPQAPLTV